MFAIKNFTDNDDVRVLGSMGPFTVVEYLKDLSVTPSTAMTAYYCNEMNVRKRQVICDLSKANITLQAGAMPSGWQAMSMRPQDSKGSVTFLARRCAAR